MATVLVVPCFNEAQRLRREPVEELVAGGFRVLLVDDGSRDNTAEVLRGMSVPGRVEALVLLQNVGKAEAVRRGMLHALAPRGADAVEAVGAVGYADADFSTPPAELVRLEARRVATDSLAVLGSRLARLGADVRRSAARHYLGRVFATGASVTLGVAVYDTQCGAKLFRAGPELAEALDAPFCSRWAFDVELIGRLMNAQERRGRPRTEGLLEVPLDAWHHEEGSKIGGAAMVRATLDLLRIRRALARDRTRPAAAPAAARPSPA